MYKLPIHILRDFAYFFDPDGLFISDKRITEQLIVFCLVSDMLKNVPNYDTYISYALVSCAIICF
jgi:hypothetical protein